MRKKAMLTETNWKKGFDSFSEPPKVKHGFHRKSYTVHSDRAVFEWGGEGGAIFGSVIFVKLSFV